ncbi:hypothetical protein QQ045_028378 [Rhodiola kirilowii]
MTEIPDPASFNATALFGVSDGAEAGTSLIEGEGDAGAVGGAGGEAVGDEDGVRVGEDAGGSDEGTGVGAAPSRTMPMKLPTTADILGSIEEDYD